MSLPLKSSSFANIVLVLIVSSLFFVSCKKDETKNLTLSFSNLEDLGSSAKYEGWIIVDGNAITTGTFTVDAQGALSQTSFEIDEEDLDNASAFVLTIEPNPDTDPAPSSVHILAGDFSGGDASLSVNHASALGQDYSSASGKYILATPTTTSTSDENSGVWFLDLSGGSPATGLNLPTLPAGWKYEGWAVINGSPVSTGTFTQVDAADDNDSFSGSDAAGPPYPGEDFITNAPGGLSFPTDLAGGTAVISIEPSPDNSPDPFFMKPLVGAIPSGAADHTTYDLDNMSSANFPSGSATR